MLVRPERVDPDSRGHWGLATCPACEGSGRSGYEEKYICHPCAGTGEAYAWIEDGVEACHEDAGEEAGTKEGVDSLKSTGHNSTIPPA